MSGVNAFLNSSGITATRRIFPRDSVIFHQDEPNLFLYFIEEGLVKMTRTDEDGKEVAFILSKGNRVGSLMSKEVLEAKAYKRQVTMLVVSKADFSKAMAASGHFINGLFLKLEAQKTAETLKLLWALSSNFKKKWDKKIINNILLMVITGHGAEDGEYLSINITHEDFAQAIGTTRETATRGIGDLPAKHFHTRSGTIKIKKKSLDLLIAEEGREELLIYKQWLDATAPLFSLPEASVELTELTELPEELEEPEPSNIQEENGVFLGEKLEKFQLKIRFVVPYKIRKFEPQCPIYGKALKKVSEEECLKKSSMTFWAKETCDPIGCRHPSHTN